jgi:hypothetical protein
MDCEEGLQRRIILGQRGVCFTALSDNFSLPSAKFGTFGTRLTRFGTGLASFGTFPASTQPPVFGGKTACVARFVPLWHAFRKLGRHFPRRLGLQPRRGRRNMGNPETNKTHESKSEPPMKHGLNTDRIRGSSVFHPRLNVLSLILHPFSLVTVHRSLSASTRPVYHTFQCLSTLV